MGRTSQKAFLGKKCKQIKFDLLGRISNDFICFIELEDKMKTVGMKKKSVISLVDIGGEVVNIHNVTCFIDPSILMHLQAKRMQTLIILLLHQVKVDQQSTIVLIDMIKFLRY